jgi:hypothetical protein
MRYTPMGSREQRLRGGLVLVWRWRRWQGSSSATISLPGSIMWGVVAGLASPAGVCSRPRPPAATSRLRAMPPLRNPPATRERAHCRSADDLAVSPRRLERSPGGHTPQPRSASTGVRRPHCRCGPAGILSPIAAPGTRCVQSPCGMPVCALRGVLSPHRVGHRVDRDRSGRPCLLDVGHPAARFDLPSVHDAGLRACVDPWRPPRRRALDLGCARVRGRARGLCRDGAYQPRAHGARLTHEQQRSGVDGLSRLAVLADVARVPAVVEALMEPAVGSGSRTSRVHSVALGGSARACIDADTGETLYRLSAEVIAPCAS